MDIYIKDDNLIIMLRSLQVKLWPTKLEDFNIPTNTINNFASKSISTISEIELESQWVYVLPSLKKGKIVYINQHIPASCPYKTYKELRRHWKNMYGYRIPEEENSPYYTISFNLMNPTLYTYPSACVKIHDISTFDSIKEKDILN
ncbi:U2 small nuclear ribonucleoprotein auxiliary factor 35 kDa subunit-related protein 1, partial [Gryllus bimaculatus]